jgi:hypothetical protein
MNLAPLIYNFIKFNLLKRELNLILNQQIYKISTQLYLFIDGHERKEKSSKS